MHVSGPWDVDKGCLPHNVPGGMLGYLKVSMQRPPVGSNERNWVLTQLSNSNASRNPDLECDKTTPKGTIGGIRPEEQAGYPHYSNSKMNPDLECDKMTPEGTIRSVTPEEQVGYPHYSNSKMNPYLECDKTTPEGTIGSVMPEEQVGYPHYSNLKLED